MNTQVLGISIDHVPCLKAWADSMGGITYPLLSDFWPHGEVALRYGVLRSEGYTERAIFILDEYGIIRYIDIHDKDEQPDNEILFAELAKLNPEAAARMKPVPTGVPLPHGGVVMYCTSWCPGCRQARPWLKEKGIAFTEVDIERTAGASDQLRKLTGGSLTTPTFDIDGEIVIDFNVAKLARILKISA